MERCENIKCKSEENVSKHHIFPRGYRYLVDWKVLTPEDVYGIIMLCDKCHSFLHHIVSHRDLAKMYNTRIKVLNLLFERDKERLVYVKPMAYCENINCKSLDSLTRHHLYPKGYRAYGNNPTRRVMCLCRSCHTILHKLKSNYELAMYYNTKEKVVELLLHNTIPVNYRAIMIRQDRLAMTG